jgi:hypothetical protein
LSGSVSTNRSAARWRAVTFDEFKRITRFADWVALEERFGG